MDWISLSLTLLLLPEANSQQTFKRDALIKLYCDPTSVVIIQNVTSDCDDDYLYLSRECNARKLCETKLPQNDTSCANNSTIKVKSSCGPWAVFSTGFEPSLTGTINLITSPKYPETFIAEPTFQSSVRLAMTGDIIITGFGYFGEPSVSQCNNNLLSLELISNDDKLFLCLSENNKERSILFQFRVKSTPWKVKLFAGGQESHIFERGFYFIFQVQATTTEVSKLKPTQQGTTVEDIETTSKFDMTGISTSAVVSSTSANLNSSNSQRTLSVNPSKSVFFSTEKKSIDPSVSATKNTVKAPGGTTPISLHPKDTISTWQNVENQGVTLDGMSQTLFGLLIGGAVLVVFLVLVSFIGCAFYWTKIKQATLALRSASIHALNTLNAAGDLPYQGSTLRVANGSNAVMPGAHSTSSYGNHNCTENCYVGDPGTQHSSPQMHRAVSKDSVYSTTPSDFDSFDDCGETDPEDDQAVIYSEPYGIVKGFNVTDIQ